MPPAAAQLIYDYLNLRTPVPPQPADAIIGFGHFDLRIARQCAQLWLKGAGARIIFTGGVGAGSADLNIPEEEAFGLVLRAEFPQIPSDAILLESNSTNTGENVRYLIAQATAANWKLAHVLLVATPFRQRRVSLTWQAQGPADSEANPAPPPSSLAEDIALFADKHESLVAQLPGEIERLQTYASHGWISPIVVPLPILQACDHLRAS